MTSIDIGEVDMSSLSPTSTNSFDGVLTPTSSQDQEDARLDPTANTDAAPYPDSPRSKESGEWTTVTYKKVTSKSKPKYKHKSKAGASTGKTKDRNDGGDYSTGKHKESRKEKGKDKAKGKGKDRGKANPSSNTAPRDGDAEFTPGTVEPDRGKASSSDNGHDSHGGRDAHPRRARRQRHRDPDAAIQGKLPGWYVPH